MSIREDAIKTLTEKCEDTFEYEDVVDEYRGKVNFGLIVEFILDYIFGVWKGEDNAD